MKTDEALAVQRPTLLDIIDRASREKVDVGTLKELWAMNLEWEANEARKAFVEAMNKFKAKNVQLPRNKHVKVVPKDESKKGADYWHITLDRACEIIVPALNEVGISHRWEMEHDKEWIKCSCILTHKMGHKEKTTLAGCADNTGGKNSIQAIASTVTYLQRYTLLAATGLAALNTDNDGAGSGVAEEWLNEQLGEISRCETKQGVTEAFKAAAAAALGAKDINAYTALKEAADKRKKEVS